MAAKPKTLIDLNIILDVLQRRSPFYTSVCSKSWHWRKRASFKDIWLRTA